MHYLQDCFFRFHVQLIYPYWYVYCWFQSWLIMPTTKVPCQWQNKLQEFYSWKWLQRLWTGRILDFRLKHKIQLSIRFCSLEQLLTHKMFIRVLCLTLESFFYLKPFGLWVNAILILFLSFAASLFLTCFLILNFE